VKIVDKVGGFDQKLDSQERRAPARLREAERRYQTLFNASPQPIYVCDVETLRIVAANEKMVQRYGWTREELLRMSALDLHPAGEEERFRRGSHEPPDVDIVRTWRHKRSNGAVFDAEVTAHDFDLDGRRLRLVIATDITERKRQERVLRDSEERFRSLTELFSDLYWETDENHRFVRMTGILFSRRRIRPEAFEGKTRWEIEAPNMSAESWARHRADLELHREFRDLVIARRNAAREKFYISLSGRPMFDKRRQFRGYHGVGMDVTASVVAQEALQKAAGDLQALSRRLVEVQEVERRDLSRELHDRIGQNLTALYINLDILLGNIGVRGSPEIEGRLRDSLEILGATARMIDDITAELRPPMLDNIGLAAALRWHGARFASRTGIAVTVDADEDFIPDTVANRDVALFRIAQEALNNAAKHAHARNIEISIRVKQGELIFQVRDDGSGFDANADSGKRIGLGMRTMRERAAAIGGQLEVTSSADAGTTLRVRVPL
jgi:PAS domain S-box-containing protein